MNVLEYIQLALAHRADPFYIKYLAGRRVLDIGAGKGDFVARDPARFVGIDVESGLVEHCRGRGLDVRVMSALRLEFPDQSFEAIHAAQLIEHFDSNVAAAFLQEASRVLVPGGVIVLTTPGVRNVWDTFSHVRPYTPMALRKLLPEGVKYTPADLVVRSADCYLTDLNQHFYYVDELFPAAPTYEGLYDWVTLLEVAEFLHDLPRVFARVRKSSRGLIVSYRVIAADIDDAAKDRRRAAGYLNDVTAERLEEYLAKAGWTIKERKEGAETHWWICG